MVDWAAIKLHAATIFSREDMTIDPDALKAIKEALLAGGFKELLAGRNRVAFLSPSGRNVVKIPLNDYGVADNSSEAVRWRKERADWYPLARCRLFCDLLVVMEVVDRCSLDYGKLPSWVSWVDCGQVGYNRRRKLVAYDYGLT